MPASLGQLAMSCAVGAASEQEASCQILVAVSDGGLAMKGKRK